MSIHSLSDDVSRIIQRLADLPGSKQLSVHTRRYPRLGPAERGHGFEEHHWSMAADEDVAALSIPADAEDVVVTWLGAPSEMQIDDHIADTVIPAAAGSAFEWEYRVSTRASADNEAPQLVVEVFTAESTGLN
jgi:hypothetical protein